jgi:quinolinate synthase
MPLAALDLEQEIQALKKQTNTVILAHYYQDEDIQDIADFIGDSLDLARRAQAVQEDRILFAGVHFMAETAKILNPEKTVLVPDLEAGCSLANSCPPDLFEHFIRKHPNHIVVSYINCSAAVKALSDLIVTSSNAVALVGQLPEDAKIIFAPDRYLGAWVAKQTGRSLVLWNGSCSVHESFNYKNLVSQKARHPHAAVVAHPECPEVILNEADFIGSTKKILDFVLQTEAQELIVVTEPGIIHQMKKLAPHKVFHPAMGNDLTCSCNTCPYMRLNTLEKIFLALKTGRPRLDMDPDLMARARQPLLAMLAQS